ncbi:uncharacterized protein LOC106666502 [Cimex lectularius]|uniref:Uncharacterized protein n=1 Tax=Cimex lectularius TaxID=79782 RepID=A0A8I6RT78_CIMLE|nr:uncharacterized protein LOC106666502 [Cimex lectularius]XP_014249237.1 uncharacterized protein LOC106666502 [Cimex lectularius]XP_014249238.1 uncharacterized protein LOC106666502 [Cimex lectularius]
MLKHTVTASSGLGRHISQDPRGFDHQRQPNGSVRTIYREPPPVLNHSYHGNTSYSRPYNLGNPYSNSSTLSNSKHSVGGTSASVSPLGIANGGLNISRPSQTPYVEAVNPRLVQTYANTQGLNISTLSNSKYSLGGNSSRVSPLEAANASNHGRISNGGLNISRVASNPPPSLPVSSRVALERSPGVKEMLTSLGLLCLVSLLLALLSLVFMLKISPVTASDVKDFLRSDQVTVISPDEYVLVYEVTLALCAFSLSLNLCCLLVCSVQFLFAVKLVRDSPDGQRTNKYLKKSAFTRVCAVGGFFVSIPVFLTGIILYTFIQFHSTPAIITSVLIGLGIIFCGCAMVHNVFVWQKEKTNAVRALSQQQRLALQEQSMLDHSRTMMHSSMIHSIDNMSPGPIPHATLDLSNATPTPPEICTVV